ncbi:hypothetical protein NA56DRAFT_636668 [Hyaloscypha hepaticicola]|uniref:Prokaryotic-type class I peptide chain release factors domain-containing protein n=1 Tax=Hyaloscypha hepaticicola TaxID=2082293 RepID=A0A2J6PIV0_9HELO|nr:hypothetical protein NA56DRAFT_636668 [Hyaloscypha hepaticicola]
MLHVHVLESLSKSPSRSLLALLQDCRAYSSRSTSDSEAADLNAAREWFRGFNKSTIPEKISKTEFSRSSGAGGQKVNKTSSKATTVWELHALYPHVPKILHQGLRNSRYYVSSSDSIKMQCDTSRSQPDNKAENHRKLFEEITALYKQRVPGLTSPEQLKRIEQLTILSHRARQSECRRKNLDTTALMKLRPETSARLRMKKLQGDKKRSRSGGGGRVLD